MGFDKDKKIIKKLKNLEIDKVYKSRKEVILTMGLDEKMNKGNSGKMIQRILDECTEYEKSGYSYKFTDISDNISKVGNTLRSFQGYRILNLIKEDYLKRKDVWDDNSSVVKISLNNLLLDVGVCNEEFISYKDKPYTFLTNNEDFQINKANSLYDWINLTNSKLRKNLFSALDYLEAQSVLNYDRSVYYIDYKVTKRKYKEEYDKLPHGVLERLVKTNEDDFLEDNIEKLIEKTYYDKRMDSVLSGVEDSDGKYEGVDSIYGDCKVELLKKYIDKYKLYNEYENAEDIKNNMFWIVLKSIDKDKNNSIEHFYNELNELLSKKLTDIYYLNDYHIEKIEVLGVRSMIRIAYYPSQIKDMLEFNFDVTKKEMNDEVIEKIKSLAKNRHENWCNKKDGVTIEQIESLKDDFRYVRADNKYVRDCENLTDLMLKLRQKHIKQMNGFNIDKSD